ncbi:TPA: conjugal transfer protein TraB, partial [Enterobacter roggenkampii]|nr:conjugal transfer protein TraB [Enterobacter roggenkampii]
MASINAVVKRKQFLWLGIVLATVGVVGGGGWYLADARYDGNPAAQGENEPAPDMTGVVDSTFDAKVQQHATTEMQATASDMKKHYEEMRRELDLLSKGQASYQQQIDRLSQDNAALSAQVSALGANPVTASGEPAPQPPSPAPGPEGEPQPTGFPPQTGAVPPPTAFYPGNGVTPPAQVHYQPIPVPNQLRRQSFPRGDEKKGPVLPYIPSGSFARSMLIEGADANASVTGNESTVPMQLRITGHVEMPNSKSYDLTGCFIGLEAWG